MVALTLEIYATVFDGKNNQSYQVQTYRDQYTVQMSTISWLDWEVSRISPIWGFLGLASPLAIAGGPLCLVAKVAWNDKLGEWSLAMPRNIVCSLHAND